MMVQCALLAALFAFSMEFSFSIKSTVIFNRLISDSNS